MAVTQGQADRAFGNAVVFNSRQVERALKALDRDLAKETRREMAKISRKVRDEVRGDWPRGPSAGGHSYRAVTSGTRGLNPTVRLDRSYRPYVGWLVFGGSRPRDTSARSVPKGGLWFYPGIKRGRAMAVDAVRKVLKDSIRKAGL